MNCKRTLLKATRRVRLGILPVLLLFLSSGTPVLGQSLWLGDAEFSVIPRDSDAPLPHSRCVMFQGASAWFAASSPAIEDFASIERVEIEYGLSASLARFISGFPKLKHLYIGEMQDGFDFTVALKPFARAKHLRSLEIGNVCVNYCDLTVVGEFEGLLRFTCDVVLSERELHALHKLRNLQHLDITDVIDARRVHAIQFPRLKELRVDNPGCLTCFDERTPIEKLVVSRRCTREDVIRISRFSMLKDIDLAVGHLDDVKPLAALEQLRRLTIRMSRE